MILPLLACLTLVGASSAPLALSSLPYGNEPLPQCLVLDDTNNSITLSAEEVNTYSFVNLSTYLISVTEVEDSSIFGTISYDSNILNVSEFNNFPDIVSIFLESSYYGIFFHAVGGDFVNRFTLSVDGADEALGIFSSGFVWTISDETIYNGVKTAIQADIEANQSGMSGVEVVNEIVDILAGGLTSLGSSLGGAIATFAQSLAFQDGELSVYFVLIVVFASVSLAIGLTTLLFNWLTNLGR